MTFEVCSVVNITIEAFDINTLPNNINISGNSEQFPV